MNPRTELLYQDLKELKALTFNDLDAIALLLAERQANIVSELYELRVMFSEIKQELSEIKRELACLAPLT